MARHRSIRTQLALTYAGIALFAVMLLAGILLALLAGYYARSETTFLKEAATRVLDEPLPAVDSPELRGWVVRSAVAAQARVRLYGGAGNLVIDSGSPSELDLSMLGLEAPTGVPVTGAPAIPATAEGSAEQRSSRVMRFAVGSLSSTPGAYILLSESPTSARAVLTAVANGSLLAGLVAVLLAAGAGWMVSARISRPLTTLTAVSDRMASGDLQVRAPVAGADELRRLSESFNAMVEQTQVMVDTLRRFVADAAHQIGTPLTALLTDLELAEDVASTDDERRLVGRASGQAVRLRELSAGLLSLSRIEAGDGAADVDRLDLVAVGVSAVDAAASRAEQAGIELVAMLPVEPVVVMGSASRLALAVDALLDNALKFTPAGGSVTLSLAAAGADAVLSVADTGMGIPADELARVFMRFHRGRGAVSYPGNGLGLAIVRATAERMGGSVRLESSAAGTRVELSVPLADAD